MAAVLTPERPLGGTGITVPLIGYGTAPLGKDRVSPEEAARCLNHAIDRGITYLDTSPDYGSEPKLGAAMRSRRREGFLPTKGNRRSREGGTEDLKEAPRKPHTDHVDPIQVHAVRPSADPEQGL